MFSECEPAVGVVPDVTLGALIHRGRGGHETRYGTTRCGARVVVKMVGPDAPPEASDRLEHEATLLSRLRGVRGVSRIIGYDAERGILIVERAWGDELFALRERGSFGGRMRGVLRSRWSAWCGGCIRVVWCTGISRRGM